MTQIKIFEGNGNNEADVNTWLKDNPGIKVLSVNMVPMHDLYGYGYGEGSGQVCNQWIATIVTYTV
jgi:hypothetical protein